MTASSAIDGEGKYRTPSSSALPLWLSMTRVNCISMKKIARALTEDMDGVIRLLPLPRKQMAAMV